MTNFKVFTNATRSHKGKKIAVDINKIYSIFQDTINLYGEHDTTQRKVTVLRSLENNWMVQEDFDTVMNIINEE